MGCGGVKQSALRFLAVEISDNERQLDKICLDIALHLGILTAATTFNGSHDC
jgi:hypothetical protein